MLDCTGPRELEFGAMNCLGFLMPDKNGSDLVAQVLAAIGGFLLGLATIWVQFIVTRRKEKADDAKNLRHLMFLLVTDLASALQRVTQYVRQVTIVQVSRSRLSSFLGTQQIWDAARLGAQGKTVNALYELHNLYELIHHQIEKVSATDNEAIKIGEFGAIFAFVRSRFPNIKEGSLTIADRALKVNQEHLNKSGRSLLVRVFAWIIRIRMETLCPPKKEDVEESHVPAIKNLIPVINSYLSECDEWIAIYDTTREIQALYKGGGNFKSVSLSIGSTRGKRTVLTQLIRLYESLTSEGDDQAQVNSRLEFKWFVLVGNEIAGLDDREPHNSNIFVRTFVLPKWKAALSTL